MAEPAVLERDHDTGPIIALRQRKASLIPELNEAGLRAYTASDLTHHTTPPARRLPSMKRFPAIVLLLLSALSPAQGAEWQPAKGRLLTRWAKDVKADRPHPEYPRPQLVRKEW